MPEGCILRTKDSGGNLSYKRFGNSLNNSVGTDLVFEDEDGALTDRSGKISILADCILFKDNGMPDLDFILNSYKKHGLDFVDRIRGTFNIAITDRIRKQLIIVRDRAGSKPLYYCRTGNRLAFASDIRFILKHMKPETERKAIYYYLLLGYIPEKT